MTNCRKSEDDLLQTALCWVLGARGNLKSNSFWLFCCSNLATGCKFVLITEQLPKKQSL